MMKRRWGEEPEPASAMPPQGGIRHGGAAFIKALCAARPRPSAGWRTTILAVLISGFWLPISAQAAPCVNPAGPEGSMIYATTSKTMFYCNGTGWVGSAGISALASLTDVSVPAPANGNVLSYNSVSGKWEAVASSTSQWTTTGSDIYYNTGNVGIGTTSPVSLLQVGNSASTGPQYLSVNAATAQEAGIRFLSAGTDKWYFYRPPSSNDLRIYDTADRVTFQSGGNVGIGTTAPSSRLHLKGDSTSNGSDIKFENTNASGRIWRLGDGLSEAGKFQLHDTSGTATRLTVDSSGNVGIGTTNPTSRFYVSDSAAAPSWAGVFKQAGASAYGLSVDCTACTTPGGYTLAAYTNAGTGMFVTNNGNVGIGTATPAAKLHVQGGNIQINNASGNGGAYTAYLGSNTNKNWLVGNQQTAGAFEITPSTANGGSTFTTPAVVIDNSGNVGIGTTSPAFDANAVQYLAVSGENLGANKWAELGLGGNITGTATSTGSIGFFNTSLGTADKRIAAISAATSGATNSGDLILYTYNAGTIGERMRLDKSGNVGIGTASPSKLLQVQGSTTDWIGYFNNSNVGGYGVAAYSSGNLALRAGNGTASDMVVTSAGSVGIGTTAPGTRLDVEGTASDTFSTGAIARVSASTKRIHFGVLANASYPHPYIQSELSGGNYNLFLNPWGGYVGIGTAAALSYPLQVNGTAYATGAAGALSDVRHKKKVKTLENGAVEVLARLRPVTYEWKKPVDDGMKGMQFGFIAQEVEKVLPAIVLTMKDEEKTKGLKYSEFIPLLTKAVQELDAENDALKAENKALGNRIEAERKETEARIDKLEKALAHRR